MVTDSHFLNGTAPLPPCPLGDMSYADLDGLVHSLNLSDAAAAAYSNLTRAALAYTAAGGRCVSVKGLPDVRLAVTYIIIYTSLCTVLFLLLTTVLLRGGLDRAKRHSPVVWLLAASILLGLVASVFDTVFWTVQMVNARIPSSAADGLYVVEDLMLFLVPWVVVWALILRLSAFWPSALFGRRKQALVIFPPSVLQCASLACYGLVLRNVHHIDQHPAPGQVTSVWQQTATTILGQRAASQRMHWDHAHYATFIAAMLYVNIGLSRQWWRMRSSRGTGALAQLRRWLGKAPDPILRLSFTPAPPPPSTPAARIEEARFLRILRPQRRVGVWWTLVRVVHFVAFGFWVPTFIAAASWAVLATAKLEVAMYLEAALVYVFPLAGIVACLGATSRFLDRENHYYPSTTSTFVSSSVAAGGPAAGACLSVGDIEQDFPEYCEGSGEKVNADPSRRRTTPTTSTPHTTQVVSLADFLLDPPPPPPPAAERPAPPAFPMPSAWASFVHTPARAHTPKPLKPRRTHSHSHAHPDPSSDADQGPSAALSSKMGAEASCSCPSV